MPFGGALSAGISAGSGLLSGVFGSKAADKAAKQVAAADQQVVTNTNNTVQSGQQGVGAATQNGLSTLANATTGGQGLISQGTTGANTTLGSSAAQQQQLYSPFTSQAPGALNGIAQIANGDTLGSKFVAPTAESLANGQGPGGAGYQFTLQQGQDAINRAAAAQGNLFSGGTLKSLANYTTGTANQYYGQAYNQALSTFQANQQSALNQVGTLQGLANFGLQGTAGAAGAIGQTSSQAAANTQQGGLSQAQLGLTGAQGQAGLGLQGATTGAQIGLTGNQTIANALTNAGQAQAAGTLGSTGSWLNALTTGTNALTGYLAGNQANRVNGGQIPGATNGISDIANYPSIAAAPTAPYIPPAPGTSWPTVNAGGY